MNYGRLVGTILLCAIGLWYAVTREARFALGGDPDSTYKNKHVTYVHERGLGAVAIGNFFCALGVINLALGIRDRRRITVFWCGTAMLALTLAYWVCLAAMEVWSVVGARAPR